MQISKKLKAGGSKVISGAMSVVLAVGLMPLPAFAADLEVASLQPQQVGTADYTGTVIAAGFAANEPTPQILGLNNPNYRMNGGSTGEPDQMYIFFGDPEANPNPDPFLVNYNKDPNNVAPTATTEPGTVVAGGRTAGFPNGALDPYNADASALLIENAQNMVWRYLPQVIVGCQASTQGSMDRATAWTMYQDTSSYLSEAIINELTANNYMGVSSVTTSNYKPIGINYDISSGLPGFVQDVYATAAAAKKAMNTSLYSKAPTTRYEDPIEIAKNYERYVKGMKGYVLDAIENGSATMRTVALVTNYDSTAGTYTIQNKYNATTTATGGTASINRFMEAVEGVSNDYFDIAPNNTAVTADDLKNDVDLIIVGTQRNDGDTAAKAALQADGLMDKTYYVTNDTTGAAFNLSANSSENAQNVGRILPCLYPELLDQSDMIAYYYDTFYHLNDSSIPKLMDSELEGVRNWNNSDSASFFVWSESDYTGYNQSDVQKILEQGSAYLKSSYKGSNKWLTLEYVINDETGEFPTSGATYLNDTAVASFQTITTSAASEITRTYGDTSALSVAGTSNDSTAKITYSSSNEDVATVDANGAVTIKAAGATTLTINASKTSAHPAAAKDIKLTVKKAAQTISGKDVSVSYGASKTISVTKSDTIDAVEYVSADPKTATVTNKGKVTGVKAGSTTITITGTSSNKSYEDATTTIKVTVPKGVDKGTTVKKVSIASGSTVTAKTTSASAATITASSLKSGASVTLNTVTLNGKSYKVTALAANSFKSTKAKGITLGANVKTIGKNAFKSASNLKTITLKTSSLNQASFKNMINGSKIKTAKLSGVSSKAKTNYKKWGASLGVTVK